MSARRRLHLGFIVLCVVAIGGVSFVAHSYADSTRMFFWNAQDQYAELATTSAPEIPAAASGVATTTVNVPILVYHIVRPSYPSDDQAVRALAQTPEVFDAQMGYLAENGYHVIAFRDLEAYLKTGAPLPTKPVIISFDDGWGDQFTYAFPILQKYGFTATFFVFTNNIGHRGFMSWADLKMLVDAGMTIGSHTRSHPFLTKITDPKVLWEEIDGSKQVLEKNLGISVNEFAYPFGQYDAAIIDLIKKAGYASARGDFYSGVQSADRIYVLSAFNVPTTIEAFVRTFAPRSEPPR